MRKLSLLFILTASPALAADGPFFSLKNTDFIVTISFIAFIGILIYFKVPGLITKMLDDRADTIKAELDEAKTLRDEAQALLTSFEKKQLEVEAQAERIVASAKEEAEAAAVQAKADIAASVARRVAAAEEQIAAAEAAAVREVRDQAVTVAIAAATDMITSNMTAKDGNALIDASIDEVGAKLH
ncbi:MAG: F0F1 ATP synthase subunit B [Planktomarina sp.]